MEKFAKHRQDLLDKLKRYQDKLEAKRAESAKLKQKFKVRHGSTLQELFCSFPLLYNTLSLDNTNAL